MKKSNLGGFAFLCPNIIGFALFTFLPVLFAVGLSFFTWDLFHTAKFVGLRNFWDILGWYRDEGGIRANDPLFWSYLWNTLFLMLGIPLNMAASLFLASMLNQKLAGRNFFRVLFYLPSICMGVGVLLLWKFLLNAEFGLINQLLAVVCVEGPAWLTDYQWAKPAIMLMTLWGVMGGADMIIYLAGLQAIPPSLYEAAAIDGASKWNQFRHITLPMLAPTSFFIFITALIGGFQGGFDAAYIMTKGGPDGSTMTISYYIFNHAFQWFNMGYASALSVILFVLVLAVTLLNWKYSRRDVEYV